MLDNTFYDFISAKGAKGTYPLGDHCHQQKQASTPVWVVTDIHGNIIINTEPENAEGEAAWVVTKGRITINRFFTSSTAMVVCACKGLDPDQPFPPLPGGLVRKNLNAKFVPTPQPIDKGDEFCIWCGYIDGLRPVTTADLIAGNLIRTFVGAVDTIVMAGNANAGVQVIIQARDRMKYLMDSLGTFNSVDFDVFKNSDGNKDKPDVGNSGEVTKPGASTGAQSASKLTQEDRTFRVFLTVPQGSSSSENNAKLYAESYGRRKEPNPTDRTGIWDGKAGVTVEDVIEALGVNIGGNEKVNAEQLIKYIDSNKITDLTVSYKKRDGWFWSEEHGIEVTATLTDDAAATNPQAQQNKKQAEEDAAKRGISRVDVIVELARRCIGHLEFSKSLGQMATSVCKTVGGYIIQKRYIKDYGDVSQNADKIFTVYDGLRPEVVNGQTTYSWNGQTDPFLGGVTRTPNLRLVAEDLVFNVISGRRPFLTTAAQNNWLGNNQNITDRVPAEFIKFLSLQEPWPTELFADSRSGEYWYAPRGLDYSGLYDPKRFFRTYFFRKAPADALASLYESRAKVIGEDPQGDWKGKPIHSCQAALLFREESTTINWRSNIIATNSSIASNTSQMAVHIKIVPYWLVGRAYPCSYYQVVDQTIGNNASELVAVALSQARLYGKELRAASLHILGDPSLVPGEAIQVVGSPLYDTPGAWITDRDKVADYYKTYEAVYLNGLYKTKSNSDGLDSGVSTAQQPPVYAPKEKNLQDFFKQTEAVSVKDSPQLSQAQIMCPATFGTETASTTDPSGTAKNSIPAGDPRESPKKTSSNIEQDKLINSVTFPEDPRSIWRVEAVIHKFNENPGDGYRTEVALASPF